MKRTICPLFLALSVGCTPIQPGAETAEPKHATNVPANAAGHFLVVAVQRTGDKAVDDRTFSAVTKVLSAQRVSQAGEKDRLMLVEISDKGGPFASGTPATVKRKYRDGEAVRDALKVHSGPTRVHDIIAALTPKIRDQSPNARVTLVIFSPMRDGLSGPRADSLMYGRLLELKEHNGLHLFIYGADPAEADRHRGAFNAWMPGRFTISDAIDEDMQLPGWGDE